jgi:hypothetical protein
MTVGSRVDVAIEVVPSVGGPLMPEPAVELHADLPARVLDITTGSGIPPLPDPSG